MPIDPSIQFQLLTQEEYIHLFGELPEELPTTNDYTVNGTPFRLPDPSDLTTVSTTPNPVQKAAELIDEIIDENLADDEQRQASDSKAVAAVPTTTMEDLLQDVLKESVTHKHEAIKELLRERISEVQRMEQLLAAAQAELQNLLNQNPEDIIVEPERLRNVRAKSSSARYMLNG